MRDINYRLSGLVRNRASIYLGASENCIGLAYVAVSRVRKLYNMVIEPVTFERLQAVKKSKDFEFRKILQNWPR